jgi:hypothetical protein
VQRGLGESSMLPHNLDPAQLQPLEPQQVEAAAMRRHLQCAAAAAAEPGRSRLQHHFGAVRGGSLAARRSSTWPDKA